MALAFQLLGPPQLILENVPVNVNRRSIVALLAYLAVNDSGQAKRTYTREALSALLWPDYNQVKAFTNLRHTLWEIQKYFGSGWLITDRETVGLHPDAKLWVDVHRFESLLVEGLQQSDVSMRIVRVAEGVKLYRHHFLAGFNLKNAPTFEEWSLAKADDLRNKHTEALTLLAEDYFLLGEAESALQYARRLVTLDPLNESGHRLLMQIYSQVGQHNAALKQYQTFEQTLRKELNIDPQPETHALYKQIRKGEAKWSRPGIKKESVIPRNNLPHRLTTFIGREQEQTEIIRLITKNRLVTLVGAGGVGKSRLALQVGEKSLKDSSDGVWLVELAPLTESTLVPQAVCDALALTQKGSTPILKILTDHLALKKTLLILDNCEHLIDACAQLAETLLQACPDLHILATSREALGIEGERRYIAPALSLPKLHGGQEYIVESEAVKLFVERASTIIPNFEISEVNASIIALICKRLDGIALAIELAAARVNLLSLEQIVERLDDAFQLLSGGSRTALLRHQTLRGTLDWSYGLLSEEERTLLRRLSIFMGGWTLEIGEEVCGDRDMLELLPHLVDKSLVFVNWNNGDAPRYYLHETIRQYTCEKLIDSGEYAELRIRHRDVYLAFIERIEPEVVRAQQRKWLRVLETEIDNIRSAFHCCVENKDAEQALRFCSSLGNYWGKNSHIAEAALTSEQALALVKESDPLRRTFWYAATLLAYVVFKANAEWKLFSDASHLKLFEQAHNLFSSINIYTTTAPVLASSWLAGAYIDLNDLASAERSLSELYEKVIAAEYQWGIAWTKKSIAELALSKGDAATWLSLLQESLELFTAIGDEWVAKNISETLIWQKYLGGKFEEAARLLKQIIVLYEKDDEPERIARCYRTLGYVALEKGEYETARIFFTDAANIYIELELPGDDILAKENIAFLLYTEGKLQAARIEYQGLLSQLTTLTDSYLFGFLHARYALVCMCEAHLSEARKSLEIALEVLKKTAPKDNVYHAYFGLGELARLENNYPEAIRNYHASLHRTNNFLNYISFPEILDGIAKAECLQRNFEKSTRLLGASEALRRRMSVVIHPVGQSDYDRHMELLKNQMSTEDFESAWSMGANMSIDEAYEYALRDEVEKSDPS
jgi:predicted ATPase/DNA-binding SARP family transcriptional activator